MTNPTSPQSVDAEVEQAITALIEAAWDEGNNEARLLWDCGSSPAPLYDATHAAAKAIRALASRPVAQPLAAEPADARDAAPIERLKGAMVRAAETTLNEYDSGLWSRGGVQTRTLLLAVYESMLAAFLAEGR